MPPAERWYIEADAPQRCGSAQQFCRCPLCIQADLDPCLFVMKIVCVCVCVAGNEQFLEISELDTILHEFLMNERKLQKQINKALHSKVCDPNQADNPGFVLGPWSAPWMRGWNCNP